MLHGSAVNKLQRFGEPSLDDIQDVCMELMIEAGSTEFLQQQEEKIIADANDFVQKVCDKHNLIAHTVSPLRWSFEQEGRKLFDDGLVELHIQDEGRSYFGFVDVSNLKITDPEAGKQAGLIRYGKIADIKDAYYLRVYRRIDRWKAELKALSENERKRFDYMITRTEESLETLKVQAGNHWNSSKAVLEDWIRLTDDSMRKLRSRMKNS